MTEPSITLRQPFDPPYYAEDVPQLDALHKQLGEYEYRRWMKSPEREEVLKHPQPKDQHYWYCIHSGCENKLKRGQWNQIKAGWYFSRDGLRAYCQDHHPSWVHDWRTKKKQEKKNG